ncbi:MAG: 4Fe-4S binding protein, partial [Candidatus Bathyarchaeota archaeon]|nr:4Fe-4S binding protein [Candidatus Bathyarchaeota archaeon]
MLKSYLYPEYYVERDQNKCIRCKVCLRQCTYETHRYDPEDDVMLSDHEKCVNCQRCVVFCPTRTLTIRK